MILALTGVLTFLCACNPAPVAQSDPVRLQSVALSATVLTATQVQDMLSREGITTLNGVTFDRAYAVPEVTWLEGAFSQALLSTESALHTTDWSNSDNDCGQFSLFAKNYAQVLYHNTPGKAPNISLAFGVMSYAPQPGHYHALNVVVVSVKGVATVAFYEPQLRRCVTIPRAALESCDFFLF